MPRPGSCRAADGADAPPSRPSTLATLKLGLSQLLAKGMSVQDMLAAAPSREFDAQWGDPTLFIANAYPGLANRARELGVNIV